MFATTPSKRPNSSKLICPNNRVHTTKARATIGGGTPGIASSAIGRAWANMALGRTGTSSTLSHSDNTVEVMGLWSNPSWLADLGKRGIKA